MRSTTSHRLAHGVAEVDVDEAVGQALALVEAVVEVLLEGLRPLALPASRGSGRSLPIAHSMCTMLANEGMVAIGSRWVCTKVAPGISSAITST